MDYNYNFNDKKRINKKRTMFVVIFLIVIITITLIIFKNINNSFLNSVSSVATKPFEMVYNFFSGTFKNIGNYFTDNEKVSKENEQLKSKITELEFKQLESKSVLDENNSLKEMLKINTTFQHFELRFARIIAREHDNWTQTFIINIGEDDGIKLNQAVVHETGLVGYISKVNKNTSTVTTILDPIASVSVNISTINEPAILQGELNLKSNNKLKLEYIPIGAQVSVGDMLYTSGLGSKYPSGIPVGKVKEVVNSKNEIDRYAIVETVTNIRTISEVGVIIK
jgi:rod shape-determining protein MreC